MMGQHKNQPQLFNYAVNLEKRVRAAHQIGMNMGLENVRDSDAGLTRRFNVNVAISSRIKDRRHSFVIVADEIGKLSDSFSLNGFKNE